MFEIGFKTSPGESETDGTLTLGDHSGVPVESESPRTTIRKDGDAESALEAAVDETPTAVAQAASPTVNMKDRNIQYDVRWFRS